MTARSALYVAFTLSGLAGLVYEVLWGRYLGLFVGHGAYAQILVLSVYLGGMAVGALAVSDRSRRMERPLVGYAALEIALGVLGIVFPLVFRLATDASYDLLFPALGAASLVGAARWSVAGLLILPQAVALGATFPLMAAGLVRLDPSRPGAGVARAYLLNTLGGAAGVLVAGFLLIGWLGLGGTSVAAGLLNLMAGSIAFTAARRMEDAGAGAAAGAGVDVGAASRTAAGGGTAEGAGGMRDRAVGPPAGPTASPSSRRLEWLLLPVAFGTAVASFSYEIGWIRMLSLLLGSATHAFELMLSAFILGLALGAHLIARASDRSTTPVRLLGYIQVGMGVAALLSLPIYASLFEVVARLVQDLPGQPLGYATFNVSRYGLALVVMLPATVLAGMTLPLLTAALLREGSGERAIGRVYAANTLGSVLGVGVAGLIALPALGLKGLLIAGAALDVAIGLRLLARAWPSARRARASVVLTYGLVLASFVVVGTGVHLDQAVITSGVFRAGVVLDESVRRTLYYRDGRTATVSAHVDLDNGVTSLSTNGKPDASLGPLWRVERRDTLPIAPIRAGRDLTTQLLAPLIALAHRPGAVNVANIGHGSGISATALLTSERIERLVTIEIEPLMVEGSLVFLPANEPAFSDPRSTYVFDDAKSFFSYRRERFDLVFAEPSNPWVSGTASLFTTEFYERTSEFLAEDGVLAQWMQIYELNDDLFMSVLAALDAVFPAYRVYLVGDADVAIIATRADSLPDPDWSVVDRERVATLLEGIPDFLPQHMDALLMFDRDAVRPLMARELVPANSNYRPYLDLGAERARFEGQAAVGTYSFASNPLDLAALLAERVRLPTPYALPPARGLVPMVRGQRGAWLREAVAAGGGVAPELYPDWSNELIHLQTFLLLSSADSQAGSWDTWATGFSKAATDLHWGTTGWNDTIFYGAVDRFLERAEAPPEARAAVDFHRALGTFDWERASAAADVLVPLAAAGARWIPPAVLLDGSVVAYLRAGRAEEARAAYTQILPRTGRDPTDLRVRLLDALVATAEAAR